MRIIDAQGLGLALAATFGTAAWADPMRSDPVVEIAVEVVGQVIDEGNFVPECWMVSVSPDLHFTLPTIAVPANNPICFGFPDPQWSSGCRWSGTAVTMIATILQIDSESGEVIAEASATVDDQLLYPPNWWEETVGMGPTEAVLSTIDLTPVIEFGINAACAEFGIPLCGLFLATDPICASVDVIVHWDVTIPPLVQIELDQPSVKVKTLTVEAGGWLAVHESLTIDESPAVNFGEFHLDAGGAIHAPSGFNNSGDFLWTGGHLGANFNNDHIATITGSCELAPGRTISNSGTFFPASGSLSLQSADSHFVNEASGLCSFSNGGSVEGLGRFFNAGVLSVAGQGDSTVSSRYHSVAGLVEVSTGRLVLSGGGTSVGGTFAFGNGGVVDMAGGSHSLSGLFSGSGEGELRFSGGEVYGTAGGEGVLSFSGESEARLVAGGKIGTSGGGWITNVGNFRWVGGTIQGTEGLRNTGDSFVIEGAGSKSIRPPNQNHDGILRNAGTIRHVSGPVKLDRVYENSEPGVEVAIVNEAGAVYDFAGDGQVVELQPGLTLGVRLENAGTLRKSEGMGSSIVSVPIRNLATGVIEVAAGTLVASGTFIDLGGAISLSSGKLQIPSGLSLSTGSLVGTGDIVGVVSNNGTVAPGAGGLHIQGSFTQVNGILESNVLFAGEATAIANSLEVVGLAQIGGTLRVVLDGEKLPADGTTVDLLTSVVRSGEFSAVEFVGPLASSMTAVISYTGNAVRLTVLSSIAQYIGPPNGSWMNPENWLLGMLPNRTSSVVLNVPVQIDGNGAEAGSVTLERGGAIIVNSGSLSVGSLWLIEGGALQLTEPESELEVRDSMEIGVGAKLNLSCGKMTLDSANVVSVSPLLLGSEEGADSCGGSLFRLELRSPSTIAAPWLEVREAAHLSGVGQIIGDLFSSGWVMPGEPLGSLDVVGAYLQHANGLLAIGMGEVDSDVVSSHLAVTGVATLDGSIVVSYIRSFQPTPGDVSIAMLGQSVVGEFAQIVQPDVDPEILLAVQYTQDQVLLVATVPGVIGDLNGDGVVGGADLAILLGAWGTVGPVGDFDANGQVDGADLAILLGAWTPG